MRRAALLLIAITLWGCAALSPDQDMPSQPAAIVSPEIEDLGDGQWQVTLRFQPRREHEQIFVAGEFNDWNPRGDELLDEDGDGVYAVTLTLPTGRHLYKFTVDGDQWFADPLNPDRQPGGYENSILHLGVEPTEDDPAPEPPPAAPANWAPTSQQGFPTPRMRPNVTFELPDDGYESVSVAGDFNDFTGQRDQLELDEESGVWRLSLRVPAWCAYRFVVERGGEVTSMRDDSNPLVTFNGHPMDSVISLPGAEHGVVMILTDSLTPTGSDLPARPIHVWLPPGFGDDPERRYPLLLMHDGQNAFDDPINPFGHGGWHVNVEAERLLARGEIDPFIIVAVPNSPRRMSEYGLGEDVMDFAAHAYGRLLIDDVIPLARERLPLLDGPENTWLMGSSMGGLISIHLAAHRPDLFGAAACLSTAFMIHDAQDQSLAALMRERGKLPIRIYLDSGTEGPREDGAPLTREMRDLLVELGWTLGDDLVWHEETGAAHTETAWRERVWRPLVFLAGKD